MTPRHPQTPAGAPAPAGPDPAPGALAPAVPRRAAPEGGPGPSIPPGGSGGNPSRPGRLASGAGTGNQPGESGRSGERAARRDAGDLEPGRAAPAAARPGQGQDEDGAATKGKPRTWTLELPPGLELLSLNDRIHWAERHRRAQALKKAVWAMALQAKMPRLEHVSVVAEYQPGDLRRRDPDNIAASAKACVDGLVAARVLADDSARFVASVTGRIGSLYPKGRLVLTLTEVDGAA